MLLNAWGIALTLLCITVFLFISIASRTAWRVLRYWNPASDTSLQISLENEIWLSSTLVEYALVIQFISLILFALAADAFCNVIIGAMCATGTLLANPFGMPALFVKLFGVFIYGIWITIHKLDVSVASYPFVRLKYYYFVIIIPLILFDLTLQTLYLINLSPEIITSCCGVIFGDDNGNDGNLMGSLRLIPFLSTFYSLATIIIIIGVVTLKKNSKILSVAYTISWIVFFILSLAGITSIFSSYIYAMPYHHCPFCILKPEYNYYGFLLYGSIIPGAILAVAVSVVTLLPHHIELKSNIIHFRQVFVKISLVLLILFLFSSSFHLFIYRFLGGEV